MKKNSPAWTASDGRIGPVRDSSLFGLDVGVAARAAGWRDHGHFSGIRRRRLDGVANTGRADHAARLRELVAEIFAPGIAGAIGAGLLIPCLGLRESGRS